MRTTLLRAVASAAIAAPLALFAPLALADTVSVDFENPPYSLGIIDGQDGWSAFGSAGSGCAVYDEGVSSSFGTTGFGSQSFRISNAVTSGCFGDQAFAKPLTDSVGESASTNGTFSPGTKQNHFEMQFDITATTSQPGLFISVSPDRGDGSRMSYLGFSDTGSGINIIFYDVQGTSNPANFVMTDLGTYAYGVHTVKLSFDPLAGASNDVVKVWINGVLTHTGTSWENYYRYDTEASAEQSPRIVKSVIFRAGGSPNTSAAGKGYLIDNLSLLSGPATPLPPLANACATPGVAPQGWTLRTGTSNSETVILTPFTMFVGNGGNDKVVAPDGSYIICTGSGNDVIKVGDGTSVIDAGDGKNVVKTGNGDQRVTTGSGNDTIATGSGNDTINAGNGKNAITAGAGNDSITTGSGNDAMNGGPGTDTCNAGAGKNAKASCEL